MGGQEMIVLDMRLRDYFAGQVVSGILANNDLMKKLISDSEKNGSEVQTEIANFAFSIANELKEESGEWVS